jgi:hypothetical protein
MKGIFEGDLNEVKEKFAAIQGLIGSKTVKDIMDQQ